MTNTLSRVRAPAKNSSRMPSLARATPHSCCNLPSNASLRCNVADSGYAHGMIRYFGSILTFVSPQSVRDHVSKVIPISLL